MKDGATGQARASITWTIPEVNRGPTVDIGHRHRAPVGHNHHHRATVGGTGFGSPANEIANAVVGHDFEFEDGFVGATESRVHAFCRRCRLRNRGRRHYNYIPTERYGRKY